MATPLDVLILEDVPADFELMILELKRAGFSPRARRVDTRSSYMAELAKAPDIILSDYSLPQFDALQALKLLQEKRLDVPFIVVSGQIGEEKAVELILQGAHDYILKDRLLRLGMAVKNALKEKKQRLEKMHLETRLHESENRFHLLVETIQEVFWMIDAENGNILYISPAYEKVWGKSCESLYQNSHSRFEAIPEKKRQEIKDAVKNNLKNKTSFDLEYPIIKTDGSQCWIRDRGFPVADGPTVLYFCGIAEDISKQKELDEIRQNYVSTVSHEIRTPLAVVQGVMDNMSDEISGSLNDEQKKYLKMGTNNVHRIDKLIHNLLDVSRLESGKAKTSFQRINPREMIEEVLLSLKTMSSKNNITLKSLFEDDLPDVYADRDMIIQVLNNLLDNAFRFARHTVQIEVNRLTSGDIQVGLTDDGEGIPRNKWDNIFQKFVQIRRPEGNTGYKGTGLGMSICKDLVELNHGKIWLESEEGKGSCFYFTLPAFKKSVDMPESKAKYQ